MPPRILPYADPRRLVGDDWFGAVRLEDVAEGAAATSQPDADALGEASRLTAAALALGSDSAPGERAARLHVLAAELKRLNGAERDCLTDYLAVVRHLLGRPGETAATLAYMRKALHVANLSPSRADRLSAKLLAAEVYVATWQGTKAGEMAREARRLAADLGDPVSLRRSDDLLAAAGGCPERRLSARCPCGGRRPYAICCGPADNEFPGEYLVRVYGTHARLSPSPYWTRGSWGLDLLMRPPRCDGGEFKTYYSWRVRDGRHRLMSYPNWSARALGAAGKMAELARLEGHGPDAAASAILQSVCALEAFETAWKLFLSEEGGGPGISRAKDHETDALDQAPKEGWDKSRVTSSWHHLWRSMFGADWERNGQGRSDMDALFLLRNAIAHSVGAPEQIVPSTGTENEHVRYLTERRIKLGPTPACWADRILTAEVADWAVEVATTQIAEVRAAYEELSFRDAVREGMLGIEQDVDDE